MTTEESSFMIEMLKRIRASQERMEADVGDLKLGMSAVEQHLAQVQFQLGGLNSRMDRFDERLTRIERRLDLIEA